MTPILPLVEFNEDDADAIPATGFLDIATFPWPEAEAEAEPDHAPAFIAAWARRASNPDLAADAETYAHAHADFLALVLDAAKGGAE